MTTSPTKRSIEAVVQILDRPRTDAEALAPVRAHRLEILDGRPRVDDAHDLAAPLRPTGCRRSGRIGRARAEDALPLLERATGAPTGARRPSARRDRGRRPRRAALHRARRERRRCAPRCRAASRCRGAPAPRGTVASPSTRDSPMPGTCVRSRRKARRDRRRGRADRPLGQQHLDEAERHQQALAVEELEVDRREARIAVEPGEARLEPQLAAIRQGREQPDLGDPVRIGDHVARDLGRPAPELVVRDRVRRRVEQPLVQQRRAARSRCPASSTAEAPRGPLRSSRRYWKAGP